MKTELIWEGKYDEYGNRRTVDIAGRAMPLQKIETIDEPASRAMVQGNLFDLVKASLLKEFAKALPSMQGTTLTETGRIKNDSHAVLS
jgi:hypothetical protein